MRDLERQRMVERQLAGRGITDPRVLLAFRRVPREMFVPERLAKAAYDDAPLPIGEGQTISQPYVVALTLQALAIRATDRVLEIGTGSGYAAALLGCVAREVVSVERLAGLAASARARLETIGFANVEVVEADGSLGYEQRAPYDAIAVAAAGPRVPDSLRRQLALGGRLVIPVGAPGEQKLLRVTRTGRDEWAEEVLTGVSFVPLIGREAWPDQGAPRARTAHSALALAEVRAALERLGDDAPLVARLAAMRVVVLGAAPSSAAAHEARVAVTGALLRHAPAALLAVDVDFAPPPPTGLDAPFQALADGSHDGARSRGEVLFAQLRAAMATFGASARAIVWTDTSEAADGSATDAGARGQRTIGELVRGAMRAEVSLVAIVAREPGTAAPRGSVEELVDALGPSSFVLCFREGLLSAASRKALLTPRTLDVDGHRAVLSLPLAVDELISVARHVDR